MLFVLPEEPIHFRDFVQEKEAAPHDRGAGWSVMVAIQIAPPAKAAEKNETRT
jgi:hypothetical protein